MKKVLAILFAVVMICSLSMSVFAVGAFVKSASYFEKPEIIEVEAEDEDCTGEIEITPYSERDDLDEEGKKNLVEAYEQIANTTDVTAFNDDFKDVVRELGLDPNRISVSDLFDISVINCNNHEEHDGFTITLKPETLKNFVGLMYYEDGKWHYVEGAEVTADGQHLHFYVDNPNHPYAIMTERKDVTTGDAGINPVWIVVAVVSFIGLIALLVCSKKAKVDED